MKSQRMPTYRPTQRGAREIAAEARLSDPAQALLANVQDPGLFASQLAEKRLYADAIRFMSHRLPRASAIWWGCLCAWEVSREKPKSTAEAVFKCIMDWLREPTEELRRQSEQLADTAGVDTPAGMLAIAVFMNSGSIAPPEAARVAPKAHMTPLFVANAVLLASRSSEDSATLQRQFLAIGRDVLEGRSHWTR